jgi:DNA helicase II / ATP-dependent DNA helicase PcrA
MTNFCPSLEQRLAIDYQGNMVVIARPGSGKTSVVSQKARKVLEELPAYQGIIAISFTNKASDELEHRCKTGSFDVKKSFFGTIDKFCLREVIFPFLRQVITHSNELNICRISDLPVSIQQLLPPIEIGIASVNDITSFLPFLSVALAHGCIPVEVVGMLAWHVIDSSAACRNYFKARYRTVFVDEYQDSGYFQHALFLKLRDLDLIAVAVGDVDQSIYSFAHKDARYLKSLCEAESGFSTFAITTNFRSHPSITDFAQRLMNPNHPLTVIDENRVFIKTVAGNQINVAHWLRTAIPHLMAHYQVPAAKRVAILCRNMNTASLIGEHLGLSHIVVQENPFTQATMHEINLFSTLLRFRYDQQLTAESVLDRFGSERLTNLDRRRIRKSIVLCRSCDGADLATAVIASATALQGQSPTKTGSDELLAICADTKKLRQFCEPDDETVQIMTLHKAKGLEFELVFHADLYDHVIPARAYDGFPSWKVVFKDEQQCLNLHYVGLTRAIKACILLTSTKRFNTSGGEKNGAPSQFIGRNGMHAEPIPW